MQARYYDPVIGRFYSNDPVGFTGEIDTFNRYSYVANNPYKYTDPNGEAKVYIWAEGPTADPENPSFAGHVSVLTEGGQGTYISKFPSKKVPWNSSAVFNTYADDVAIYGRDADKVIDIDLHSEEGADKFARGLKADPTQQWSATNNCADAVESVLNAGGLITPKGDVINTPENVRGELNSIKSSGYTVHRVTGRLDSKKTGRTKLTSNFSYG